ncbi:putative WRKY transcription factor 53 [Nicotiana tabacum]|uniref:WRKY transcription factor 53 n=2 Tax=Nicotiana TaxID=4085 RepID=A0A1S4D4V3_TOBAC|nr:PREDICTED: probable WRKY transcription factor 53 [Nicotiana sylvestris]XP_016508373.1 PREDICTED: probable WRKY transcription factor 53 [Nicotiana tabacum]
MDCAFNWEYNTLINELTQGIEHTKQLRAYLRSMPSISENQELLLQKILSSYEQSLLILKCSGSAVQSPQPLPQTCGAIESSVSVDGSPRSDDKKRSFKDQQELINISKKRKSQPTWTEQVKVSAETGFEGPTDDGYSWRKYGQKDILGAKYPRSYYRCTYRHMQNCWTTKQVQRSDDDPTVFEITYKGSHTCHQATNSALQPKSPENQEFKKQANYQTGQYSNEVLMNLRANLRVDTNDLDKTETTAACSFSFPPTFSSLTDENQHFQISHVDENLMIGGGYSPSFVSPTTPESNYFSISSSCQMNGFGMVHNVHRSESDLTDIFSANTSSTSSPIVGSEFSLDHFELDPNFPFDNPRFFS